MCDLCRARVARIDELEETVRQLREERLLDLLGPLGVVPEPIIARLKRQEAIVLGVLMHRKGIVRWQSLAAALDGSRSDDPQMLVRTLLSAVRRKLRVEILNFTGVGYRLTDASRTKLSELTTRTPETAAADRAA